MLRLVLSLLCALLLAPPAFATWSIVLVDRRTGEIAIASATCLTGFDLAQWVPVVVVGKGAAAAQSYIDGSGRNRTYLRDQLRLGTDPAQILAGLSQLDPGHQMRQYGIVDVSGRSVGFTGSGAGAYADDRAGMFGDIAYAVQGNVLTGAPVLAAIEIAIHTTPGDLAAKLMAGMEAARQYGGDGRCSCTTGSATSCGSPPATFTKSAHCAFMIVSRPGDTDGGGFADGSYYMRLNVAGGQPSDPDPVLTLRTMFDQWKQNERGHADHFLSTVEFAVPTLPRSPGATVTATLTLRDRDGTRITHGGASVTVARDPASPSNATVGAVTDNGDGTYGFVVTSGTQPGRLELRVTVDDGRGPRRIAPQPSLGEAPWWLWVSRSELSSRTGGSLDFAVQPTNGFCPGCPWILLASASGTQPGIRISPHALLRLNPDPLFDATVIAVQTGVMPELVGVTSPSGLDATRLAFPPGLYTIPPGTELSFAFTLLDPSSLGVLLTSNAVTVGVTP